ncbi:MAG: Rrf2 family transcriptional regulator [Spirochaetes bacterium]|nr:Rrf2 family transcriptional regulator [Spirochaetota bacterium]
MKLSTRARYGLRLLFELSLDYRNKSYLFLKDISERQNISEKYLSNIIIPLKAAKIVTSARGAHGGYSLAKAPENVTIKEVVDILEGNTIVVECLGNSAVCGKVNECPTQDLWKKLETVINNFLSSITLKDIVNDYQKKLKEKKNMYYI